MLTFTGVSDRNHFCVTSLSFEDDSRILHGQLAANISINPFDLSILMSDTTLCYEIVDISAPILNGTVSNVRASRAISSTTAECNESVE